MNISPPLKRYTIDQIEVWLLSLPWVDNRVTMADVVEALSEECIDYANDTDIPNTHVEDNEEGGK